MTGPPPDDEPTRRQWAGFWNMIVLQTQNAFNDKAAQFLLIPLAGAVAYSIDFGDSLSIGVESVAGLMIALPFVLFAPIAGWMSDRFSKRDVMFGAAVLQLFVLLWICAAIMLKHMPMALAGFFALAVQSAFFSPAKIGINKELVGSKHLGFAASTQQMMAMMAMLTGQIAAGYIFDSRYRDLGEMPPRAWDAAFLPLALLTALAVPALILAYVIPRVPAQGSERFSPRIAIRHFEHLADLWRNAGLRRASLGEAFFWGFAAFINLWSVKVAKMLTDGQAGFGTLSSMFMAAASLGMVAGFGAAAMLLRRRIELGWVPVAGICMTVMSLVIANLTPGGPQFLVALGLLAFFSAIFLAPLASWLQDHYPAAKRGEMQSAVNLQDCFAGIIAVAFIEGMVALAAGLGMSEAAGFRLQITLVGVGCGLMTWFIIRRLAGDFIRVLGVALIRAVYQVRMVHPERVPAKGGAMLLPNHVTFADAFFISAACRRPVRFVMDEAFMASPAVRVFVSIFHTVTIRRDQPREAIRTTIGALKSGDLVCLFPEGQITRTGTLCPLRRGFELIARKSGHPLIPVWCDGSWGSVFSFERGRFFRKRPYRVPYGLMFAFGRPLPPEAADLETVRRGIMRAAANAIARRFHAPGWALRIPEDDARWSGGFRGASPAGRRRMWANGYQLGQTSALPRRGTLAVLEQDAEIAQLAPLLSAFPELFKARVRRFPEFVDGEEAIWVGGMALRRFFEGARLAREVTFYDFSARAWDALEVPHLLHCPCLEIGGMVVSMSMADPPRVSETSEEQFGRKRGSLGKLLPGWVPAADADGNGLRLLGPAARAEGVRLPAGMVLDEDGFLIPARPGAAPATAFESS
jgi:acyl-[acyl-carrier-protein]-phospholipid O-acyltransferase/long-chain-fatty-acid--[acyl-carrier-protein] ligase